MYESIIFLLNDVECTCFQLPPIHFHLSTTSTLDFASQLLCTLTTFLPHYILGIGPSMFFLKYVHYVLILL